MKLKTARRFLTRSRWRVAKGEYSSSFQKRLAKCKRIVAAGGEELSILEKEFTKLSNAHREAQMSIFSVKKIPFNMSSKSKSHPTSSQVIDRISAGKAAELLHILERRLSA